MGTAGSADALRRARHLVDLGRWDDGLRALAPALADPGREAEAQCLRAQCLLSLTQPREAQRAAERAVALRPEDAWAHRLRAIALMRRRRPVRAIAAAREAARLAPFDMNSQHVLAVTLSHSWRHRKEASAVAEQLVRSHPTSDVAHGAAAAVAANRRRWAEAEEHARRALALDPLDADHARLLGQVLQHRGRRGRREAADVLLAAARTDPTNAANRRLLGRLGAPVLGTLFVTKYLLGRVAVEVVQDTGPLTRATVLLGGIVLLGSVMVALRVRGARHLPPEVRQGLLRTEHRNHALRWLLGLALVAFGLGVIEEVGVLGSGRVVTPLVVVQLLLAGLAGAAVWRWWSGPRPRWLSRRPSG